METAHTINVNDHVRVRMEYDTDYEMHEDDDIKIAYLKRARSGYGTEGVSDERMDEIGEKIRHGEYLGMPVYVYEHSGATMRTAPFSCPWDSGQSGFVYCTKEQAKQMQMVKILTKKAYTATMSCLQATVESYDNCLTGNVYGIVVDTRASVDDEWEERDSCWGYNGFEYAKEEAERQGAYWAQKFAEEEAAALAAEQHEQAESEHWAQRDVMTVGV
jgi:hypothetical protein